MKKQYFPYFDPKNLVILSHSELYLLSLVQIQDDDTDYNLN